MRKIGKVFYTVGFFLVFVLLVSPVSWAQSNVSVEASLSQTTVYTGERVSLSISISGSFNNVSRPELPRFENFRLLSNNPSTSRSYRYVNGQSTVSYTYSYYLIAQKQGEFQLPRASVSIDGETYTTNPIPVSVIDQSESATTDDSSGRPDIFLKLEVSDKNPVTGQQVITDVILYFRDGLEVNSYQPVPGWKAEGFWKEELENSGRPRAESTVLNGIRYRKARLLQFSLFPTKSGELEISPYKIVVAVRSARSGNDPFSSFFSGFGSNQREVELSSDPITVDVQSLSPADDATYIGAVGDFDISRSISTGNALVGESIEIETRVRGSGNIPLISKPSYNLPEGLEIYEPQENTRLNRKNSTISGSKSFTDVIIARSTGRYTIPAKKVSYYNPTRDQYITTTLEALTFSINENPEAVAASGNSGQFPVSPITGLASWMVVSPGPADLMGIWWFWTGLIIPLVIVGVAYWRKSYAQKMKTDTAFARSVKASDKARQRLKNAIEVSEQGDIKQAYNLLQKAITGFISDRLNMSQAGLSNQDYIEALKDQDIEENLVKNVRMLLEKCATISYAPNTTHAYLKSHVGLAESTLEKLQKVL